MKFIKENIPHLFAAVVCYTFLGIIVKGIGPKILGCNPFLVVAIIFGIERCLTTNVLQKVKRIFKNAHKMVSPLFDFGEPNPSQQDAAYEATASAASEPKEASDSADARKKGSLLEEIDIEMAREQNLVLDADYCEARD